MPTFTYLAKKNLNESVEGIIVADTQDQAVDKLIEMGLSPVRVQPQAAEAVQAPTAAPAHLRGGRLNQRDLAIFTNQLKSLVKARVDLLKALSILYTQADKERFRSLILDLHTTVKNGATFSDALARHREFFSSLYVNLIKTGEASGRLDDVLLELDNFLSKEEEFRMHVRTALAYPILMITVGVAVIFVLFSYVIPKLSSIFSDFDYQLPLPTKIMLAVSGFFKSYWWAILLAAVAFFVTLIQMSRNPAGRAKLDWLKLKIPVVSSLTLKQSLSRFCRTLSLLIRSGLPVFQALQVSVPTLENAVFVKDLERVGKDVLEGVSLSTSMRRVAFLPPFMIQMISVGEEGGKLESVLTEIANIYTQETDAKLKVITSLLEPLIILFLGVILGAIVLAMMLPIFQINMLVK